MTRIGPVYGGTPADFAVVQAIQEMKARGLRVTFYPFILMDVPPGNTLPNPYSDNAAETGQPAFPWRGRITCSPAAGFAGSVDKTATAASQVAAFFGSGHARRLQRLGRDGLLDRRARRLGSAPHGAALRPSLCRSGRGRCFLIGTEMRGADDDPLGRQQRIRRCRRIGTCSADVRSILGSGTKIGYAADWSEYFGHQPGDGSATCSSTSTRSGPIRRSISSGSTTTCRSRTGATASSMPTRPRAGPPSTTGPTCRGTSPAAKASTGSMPAPPTVGAGPHPDHRRRRRQAVGLPLQGSARLVVEPALRPPRWGGERHADGMGAAIQADLVHRARLSRPSTAARTSPTSSSTRNPRRASCPTFLAAGATMRSSAPISRRPISGGATAANNPVSIGLRRPDGARPRMRRLDLGRAALSLLPGADRRLDGRRELAARPLADRSARRGVAGGPRPPPLPARRAARGSASTSPASGARSRATPSPRWRARAPRSPRWRGISASTRSRPRA